MSITGTTLTVEPTISSQISDYSMRVTQTTSIRPDFSWIGAVVTVTCTIESFNVPDLPTETTYLIDSGDLVINLTPNFLQYPPCDYALDELAYWDFEPSPAPITYSSADPYTITISSNNISQARVQTLTFINLISYGDQDFSPQVSFDIELLHPCRRTTFDDITIANIVYQLEYNQDFDSQVDIPTDAASTTFGDGWDTCGARTYEIKDSTGATATWVSAVTEGIDDLAANKFAIRVAIDDETYADNSPHTMTVTVGLADYPVADDANHPTITFNFVVEVLAAVCNCSLIEWNTPPNVPLVLNAMVVTQPAQQDLLEAGPDLTGLTATSGARACDHDNDECQYGFTISARMENADPLPDWITYTQPTLFATPVLSDHIGEFYIELVQVRTWDQATTNYIAGHVIVTCTILTWTPPTMPTIAEATYTVFDEVKTITMAPAFDQ